MKLLLVDDEPEILKKMTILAESHGHAVKSATSVESLETLLRLKSFYPNVIILDRILNGIDSVHMIPTLKQAWADCRLIIVSAIDTASEKASALDAGADDYLAKPFSAIELMARVSAVSRRKNLYEEHATLDLGNVSLCKEERSAKITGHGDLQLSQKEFQLLHMFCANPGKIFPRPLILEQIWQASGEVESKVVEATINNLRRKLESQSATISIKNMRNVGYWLEA